MASAASVAKRSTKLSAAPASKATDGDIARRAHDLYLARGREPGHDVEDWLQAEQELRPPTDEWRHGDGTLALRADATVRRPANAKVFQ
jgi:hypothetical protein